MKYLLDTNICIQYLNNRSEKIINRLLHVKTTEVAICSVVKAELYLGAQKSKFREKTLEQIENFMFFLHSYYFDDIAAKEYGIIRATLEMSGNVIGPNDLMIAAIAKANNLILVTNNTQEFNRISDLTVEDWSI